MSAIPSTDFDSHVPHARAARERATTTDGVAALAASVWNGSRLDAVTSPAPSVATPDGADSYEWGTPIEPTGDQPMFGFMQ